MNEQHLSDFLDWPKRESGPVSEPEVNCICKGCVPERRFWSEHELVKHIREVRDAPQGTVAHTESEGSGDESRS